jgi:hypothetical protein
MLSSWQKSEDNNGGDSFLDGGVGRLLMAQSLGVSAPLAEITIIGSVEQLANQVWWLSANPVFSSAAQPIRLFGYTKHFVSLKGTWSRITK